MLLNACCCCSLLVFRLSVCKGCGNSNKRMVACRRCLLSRAAAHLHMR